MTVLEFTKLDKASAMYRVVDASQTGYMTMPHVLIEADKNVIRPLYGANTLIGFELYSKKTITIYVDPTEEIMED